MSSKERWYFYFPKTFIFIITCGTTTIFLNAVFLNIYLVKKFRSNLYSLSGFQKGPPTFLKAVKEVEGLVYRCSSINAYDNDLGLRLSPAESYMSYLSSNSYIYWGKGEFEFIRALMPGLSLFHHCPSPPDPYQIFLMFPSLPLSPLSPHAHTKSRLEKSSC